jgi:hypothetical protein
MKLILKFCLMKLKILKKFNLLLISESGLSSEENSSNYNSLQKNTNSQQKIFLTNRI